MDVSALFKMSYGVYIVSSEKEGEYNAQISNTAFMVTNEPMQIAVAVNKLNFTHSFIESSGKFAVNVLSTAAPMKYIGRFGFKSGRTIDKFVEGEVDFKVTENGLPIPLDYTLSYIECEVVQSTDCGTHTLFIGKVLDAENTGDGDVMTYSYYHSIKNGKEPETAPTFIRK